MDTIGGLLLAIGWFLLRFGVPVLVCWIFRRMDARWQAEGEAYRRKAGIQQLVPVVRCWLFNDCSVEQRAKCKAFQDQSIPCWQHFRRKNGELKEDCIGCGVFRGVLKPVIGD
jgi:hypothetical protein